MGLTPRENGMPVYTIPPRGCGNAAPQIGYLAGKVVLYFGLPFATTQNLQLFLSFFLSYYLFITFLACISSVGEHGTQASAECHWHQCQ